MYHIVFFIISILSEHIVLDIARESSLRYDGSMTVQKRGRTTEKTVGILTSGGGSVSIRSKNNNSFQTFQSCYLIGDKDNRIFFDEGDSGSAVFLIDKTENKLKPLGIAFARLEFGRETFVCKIDKILQEFNISVIKEGDELMDT